MNKDELLDLEKNSHLSLAELRRGHPELATALDKRLEVRARTEAIMSLPVVSEKLRTIATTIRVPIGANPERTGLREATVKGLRDAVAGDRTLAADPEIAKELDALDRAAAAPAAAASDASLAKTLRLDEPLVFHPEFQPDLDAARVYRLGDAVGLPDPISEVLIKDVGRIAEITDTRLETLIKERKLAEPEARSVGAAATLYNVLDERPDLVKAVNATTQDPRELVKHAPADWKKLIADSKVSLPPGMTVDAYADGLATKVRRLFPTDTLANRLGQVDAGAEAPQRLANQYVGMRLADVKGNPDGLARRVGLVNHFLAANTDVLDADLTIGSQAIKTLKFGAGASDEEKAMVLATARAYQRTLAVTDDIDHAAALVAGGFPSALSMAMSRPPKIAQQTGLGEPVATAYYEKAQAIAESVSAHAGTMLDVVKGGFTDTKVGNVSTEILGFLKEIPGFAAFFGSQNYCNCTHCRSILGPAAYFVDLMQFVDEQVSETYFAAAPAHPLNLKTRRPDLWTLALTCENTNKEIPYLVIIDEILENTVAAAAGYVGNFGDRAAVEQKVYRDTLPDRVDSFVQPLHLAFEELRAFLRHYDRTFADVAEAGNAAGPDRARLLLGLPPRDYWLITHPDAALATLTRIYGIAFTETGGLIDKFDAQTLLKPMGVSREELSDLVATRYVTANGVVAITITGEKRSNDSIQNDIERIGGLTRAALDRMHRFVRLWRATGWRIGELDLVISHLESLGLDPDLNPAMVAELSRIHRIQKTRDVSVEELAALWSLVPREAVLRIVPPQPGAVGDEGGTPFPQPPSPLARYAIPLFDRLFNQKRFVDMGGTLPQPATQFLHPALANVPPVAVDANLHRLLAATGADENQLLQLILGLALPLGIDPASHDDAKKKFALTERNLTLLYRHQRLAKLLKVTNPELFALAALAGLDLGEVERLNDLEAVLDLHKWWKTTKWTVAQLVQLARPGLPAEVTSRAAVAATAAGTSVTYIATVGGTVQPAETITFAAHPDLMGAIDDWNLRAVHTQAYRSDAAGTESLTGTFFSIRVAGGAGARLEITADPTGIFTAAPPLVAIGRMIDPPAPFPAVTDPAVLAREIVDQVRTSGTLVFADAVFAQIAPTAPIATSAAAVGAIAAGQAVTYTLVRSGHPEPANTVTFAGTASLDAAIGDWNSKAPFTRAYRSDASGTESAAGTFLSVTTVGSSGSSTRLLLTADTAGIFAATLPREFRGAEVTPEQSSALVAANIGLLEVVDPEGRYRLKSGFDPAAVLARPALTRPMLTSKAALANTGAGGTFKMQVVVNGAPPVTDSVTLTANEAIDAAVTEWNAQAAATTAYRSDAAGVPQAAGTFLSIQSKGIGGQNSLLTSVQDPLEIFASGPAQARGTGVWVDPALEPALRTQLLTYHSQAVLMALLPGRIGALPAQLPPLVSMVGEALAADKFFRELRGDAATPVAIAALIEQLRPLIVLFAESAVFDADTLSFIQQHRALFGIAAFGSLDIAMVRRVELFRKLRLPWLTRDDTPPDLMAILLAFTAGARFGAADQAQLAALLDADVGLTQSLEAQLTLATTPFEVLQQLLDGAALARDIYVGGSALKLAQSTVYDDLAIASAAVQAGFRAQYPDEAEWEKKVESLRDTLLGRRRDGLVPALIHSGIPQFDEVTDLYNYFLLDVQLEGCARTSRVASAIDSVQLYVQRCVMNLEETPPGAANPVHVMPVAIPAEEWSWRKNYRVWEANRKIFLYPENYIEPELRDNKTPLFKQLEEDLLSKEITDEAIVEAYARYLRGFDDLAHLTISGSYHERDDKAQRDVLHLFGVTADEPPIYYYRRVENAHYGVSRADRATHWGAWEKVDTQIPVRKVAPLVHQGQLYVFWNRYTTKSVDGFDGGTSKLLGYQHRAFVEFSKRRLDGSWTPPQHIDLTDNPFNPDFYPTWYREKGIILDSIIPKSDELIGFQVTANFLGMFDISFVTDANGRAVIDILGYQVTIQLPADSLDTHNPSTVKVGDTTFNAVPIRGVTLVAPLYDNKAHPEAKDGYTLDGFGWDQLYPSTGDVLSLRGFDFQMWSPVDLYHLRIGARYEYEDPADTGVPWVNPGIILLIIIIVALGGGTITFDLPEALVWSRAAGERRYLHIMRMVIPCFDTYAFASLLVDEARFKKYRNPLGVASPFDKPQWSKAVTDYLSSLLTPHQIADVPGKSTLEVVNGSPCDVIIQTGKDGLYLQQGARADGMHHLRRLGTSVSDDIADVLFNQGLEQLLATATQMGLAEHPTDVALTAGEVFDATKTGQIDFQGPMTTYFQEIFFHIPFLIANHLNSQGRYEESQRWYHYIFDPTSSETITGIPAGLPPEEQLRRELDRNWRYREFRGLTLDTLRAQLTNGASLEEYKLDPFNPHAIARLRISAYQKSIVMKYVDNLLDWGDDLFMRAFAQLNPEYLREATLKYVMAQEILGDRPARLGDCGEGDSITFASPDLQTALETGSEFLLEVESIVTTRYPLVDGGAKQKNRYMVVGAGRTARESIAAYVSAPMAAAAGAPAAAAANGNNGRLATDSLLAKVAAAPAGMMESAARMTSTDILIASRQQTKAKKISQKNLVDTMKDPGRRGGPSWGVTTVRHINPIFCVPGNDRMLSYWDRVDDRLYKLRHCQDIDGVFRILPLFSPPIDPALLVGGKAAGLSLDDILAAGSGSLPPYRFRYLIEKAKGFAASVQGFGSALLSALERRDGESLTKLRNVQQKNILAMTTDMKRNELKIAEENLELARRRSTAAQYRYDYYDGLITTGLTPAEITETAARVTSTVASATRLGLATAAGVAHLVPQVGSPFAMKFGGKEVGDSLKSFATVAGVVGSVAEMVASISGIVAGFERREQGWQHQRELASHDLKAAEKDIAAADLRRIIADRAVQLHAMAREQQDEIIEFFGSRFTNLGLYTFLSRELQLLHRQAYNNALALSRLAEQAYRFERPGDDTRFLGGEWDAARSGLLVGERLTIALQNMDKRFVETNPREAEINQNFSLAQINPEALVDLRETGRCEFVLPEFFFDLYYPGQYRRRIRAVRLTMPAVTGPYTNISAKLSLLRSFIRRDAVLGTAHLFEVPPAGTTSVATSTGQGDAGVFELSFRDERYMPFEGAGAVSEWRLELPKRFRPFDYDSITDVILNISYTAEEDDALREQVESSNAALEGSLQNFLSNQTMVRVFSMRQEFSSAFNRLEQAPPGTPVTFDITDRHFPLFLQGRALTAPSANLVLAVEDRTTAPGAVAISVNGTPATNFPKPVDPPDPEDPFGGLPVKPIGGAFAAGLKRQHTLVLNNAGNLAPGNGAGNAIDPAKLRDIMIVLEYGL